LVVSLIKFGLGANPWGETGDCQERKRKQMAFFAEFLGIFVKLGSQSDFFS
jgi:hypothetical protein